jgi:hypothetical protein
MDTPLLGGPSKTKQYMSRRAVTITGISTIAAIAVALLSTFFRAGPELGSDGFDIDPVFGIPKPLLDTPVPREPLIPRPRS